jgi:oxygen-independent coproporphyrinogen-3 oxidase
VVRHLYVHIPFCVRRCSYCDFSIAVRKRVPGSEYVHAVLRELELLRDSPGWVNPGATPRGPEATGAPLSMPRGPEATGAPRSIPRGPEATGTPPAKPRGPEATGAPLSMPRGPEATDLDTLYLGGGTPSLLPAEAIQRLLHDVALQFGMPRRSGSPLGHSAFGTVEVTLEANPEDVTPDAARAWRSAGVNRVSLGAQSFDDRVLQWMHRSHDAARIGDAVRVLREAGMDNVSLDLIFALPAELERDWTRDLDQAISLLPAHLSLYGLTVEPRTPLDRWISRGAVRPADERRYADEYLMAHERLSAAGYQFYEVSNAARDGYRSRHNSAYWSGRPYLGLGPAAHSFDGRVRRWNIPAWEAYRRAVAEGRSTIEAEETLTPEQQDLERVYLALRTSDGLALSGFPAVQLAGWLGAGWVVVEGDRVRCTPEGWLRLDGLVAKLFVAKELPS